MSRMDEVGSNGDNGPRDTPTFFIDDATGQ
jgi:hypothetical protein